jgi:hypothetical protein
MAIPASNSLFNRENFLIPNLTAASVPQAFGSVNNETCRNGQVLEKNHPSRAAPHLVL